jgi:hypothetical protein
LKDQFALSTHEATSSGRGGLRLTWISLAAIGAALVVAALLWARSDRKGGDAALRAELSRLEAQVQALRVAKDAAGSSGFASPQPTLALREATMPGARKEDAPVKNADPTADSRTEDADPRARLEEERFETQQASERLGNRLDEYLSTEPVDAAWSPETTRALGATLRATTGQKLVKAECATHLCRVVVESDSAEEQRQLPQKISGTAPFNQDVFYRYDFESTPPKTTLYVAREGTPLGSLTRTSRSKQ